MDVTERPGNNRADERGTSRGYLRFAGMIATSTVVMSC